MIASSMNAPTPHAPSRLEQAVPVTPILIFRPHPLEDHRQKEHDPAGAEELLPDPLIHNGLAEIAGSKLFDLVRVRRVVVDARLEAVDPVDNHVDLDWIERARGRRRPPRVAVQPVRNAAAQVEQPAELVERHRQVGIGSNRTSALDRLRSRWPRFNAVGDCDCRERDPRRPGVALVEVDRRAPARQRAERIDDPGLAPLVVHDADVRARVDGRRRAEPASEREAAERPDRQPEETATREDCPAEPRRWLLRFEVILRRPPPRRRWTVRPGAAPAHRLHTEPGIRHKPVPVEHHVGDGEPAHEVAGHRVVPEVVEVPQVGDQARQRSHRCCGKEPDADEEVEVVAKSVHRAVTARRDVATTLSRAVAVPLHRF